MAARSEPAPPIARIADGDLPDIAIGILSHNRVDEVERSLDVFLASDYPTDRLHLIVVDNASTDGTRERVLERYGGRVEVVRLDENMGALARNVVLLGRPERYLFQFDEDCAPADPDTLRRASRSSRRIRRSAASACGASTSTPAEATGRISRASPGDATEAGATRECS